MLSFPPDTTFFVQFVSFFVLLALLNRWLFVPFMQLLEERRERSEGAMAAAQADNVRAKELEEQVAAALAAARREAMARAEEIRCATRLEEQKIFAAAEREAANELAELRAGIDAERSKAAVELEGQAREIATAMVDRLLKGRVQVQ